MYFDQYRYIGYGSVIMGLKEMKKKTKRLTIILTVIYAVMMMWIILFKMSTLSELSGLAQIRSINLIPFHYDVEMAFHMSEVRNNIAIFVPLGVYLKMLKFSGKKAVVYGAGFSLSLEILQFVIGIGATDITDFITNTLGTVVGVCIYGILLLIFRKEEKLNRALNALALVCTVLLATFITLLLVLN